MPSVLQVGSARAERGQRAFGVLRAGYLPDGSPIEVPIVVLNGRADGPVLWLSAAMHGTEIAGTEVIRRVVREEVDPGRLRGAIIAAPVLNPLAYTYSRMTTPQDDYNLNRVFPGDPKGLLSFRLAHLILNEGIRHSDVVVDFHANPPPAMNFALIKHLGDDTQFERSRALAEAFGVTVIEMLTRHEGHRVGTMTENVENRPWVVLELVPWRRIEEESVQAGVRGTLNIMRHLGMVDGPIEPQTVQKLPGRRLSRVEITADVGGLVYPLLRPGDPVRQGQTVAVLRNLYGDIVDEVKSPVDGWILAYPLLGNQAAATGDFVAFIAYEQKGAV